jgi:hypothetical protein
VRICEISYQPSTCSYRLSSPLGQFNIGPGSAACGTNTRSNQRAYWTGRSRSFSSRHAGSVDLNLSASCSLGRPRVRSAVCFSANMRPSWNRRWVVCSPSRDGGVPIHRQFVLHGLGSLRSATALRLLRAGWPAFLLAWGGTLAALWLPQAIPQARPAHRRHRRSRPRRFATSLSVGSGQSVY